jgi:DNA polymerase III epsilon subunit-like protein
MTKYLSVDTETSGLDPDKSELLEVGIVVFDTEDSELVLTSYNSLRIVFVKEQIQGNIFAINMNINLLNEILTMSKEFDKLGTGKFLIL